MLKELLDGAKGQVSTAVIVAILAVVAILGVASLMMAVRKPVKPPAYTGEIEGRWVPELSDMGNISTTTTTDDTLRLANYSDKIQYRKGGGIIEVDGLINTLQLEYEETDSTTLADNIDPSSLSLVRTEPSGVVSSFSKVEIDANSISAEIPGDLEDVDIYFQMEQKSVGYPGAVAAAQLGKAHFEAVKAGDDDEFDLLLNAQFE